MEDIGTNTPVGITEPFTDNSIPICARCDIKLTNENKSQWSDVIKDNKTQNVCINCRTLEEIETDKEMKEA